MRLVASIFLVHFELLPSSKRQIQHSLQILALILSNPCPIDKATAPSFSQGTLSKLLILVRA